MAAASKELVIEITSDFVCPWCYVGEARLEAALKKAGPGLKVQRQWRPLELNPSMPEDGMDRRTYLAQKFGGAERLKEIDARLKEVGAEDGLDFRPDLIKRSPNTLKAHRLMLLAAKEDKADKLASLIFRAYFTEGRDIGDADVLTALAAAAGMDAKRVKTFLATDEGTDEIRRMEEENETRGISRVPFFVIGDETIEGAIPAADLAAIIADVLKNRAAA